MDKEEMHANLKLLILELLSLIDKADDKTGNAWVVGSMKLRIFRAIKLNSLVLRQVMPELLSEIIISQMIWWTKTWCCYHN